MTPAAHVRLTGCADVLTMIPYLLGFTPTESVVLVGLSAGSPRRVRLAVRLDLSACDMSTVAQAASVLRANDVATLAVVVVASRPDDLAAVPFRARVDRVAAVCAAASLSVVSAIWAAELAPGAPWACYLDPACGGRLPDPTASASAAAFTATGAVTFADRDELTELVRPDPPELLARRSAQIVAMAGDCVPYRVVADAVERARAGRFPTDDAELARLALTLARPGCRDRAAALAATDTSGSAETLWLVLTRALPDPYRAEPACLAAIAAAVRGNGALANVAVAAALQASPRHTLARLLDQAMRCGIAPDVLRDLLKTAS